MDVILIIIIACEIGFWVFVLLGLLARYVLRRPRTGLALLAMTPVVDLVLLTAVIIHLHAGGAAGILWLLANLVTDPSRTHALPGLYPILGIWFTIYFTWAISCTVRPRRAPSATTWTRC